MSEAELNEIEEDPEYIEALRASVRQVGEIHEVIIDVDGDVLSGRHRMAAGWKQKFKRIDTQAMSVRLGIPRAVVKEMVKIHSNLQRSVSEGERREQFIRIAEALHVVKGIPKDQISPMMLKYVPFGQTYIDQLLPDEFKQQVKVEAGRKGGKTKAAKLSLAENQEGKDPANILSDADKILGAGVSEQKKITDYIVELFCPHCRKIFAVKSVVPFPDHTQYEIYRSSKEAVKK